MKTVISHNLSTDDAIEPKMVNELLSISKGKKPKSHRAAFLSAMMKGLGGDDGNDVAEAFANGDVAKFKEEMAKIVDKVATKMPK